MSTFEIKMPKLGESITEGTIVSWSVKVGDSIKEDDILFEVTTAKVNADVPSPVFGTILELLAKEGDTVPVGGVVAIIQLEGEEAASESESGTTEASKPNIETTEPEPETSEPNIDKPEANVTPTEPAAPSAGNKSKTEEARWYSPVVLQLAGEAKIPAEELDQIPGTGYLGRLSKTDINRYIEQKKAGVAEPVAQKRLIPSSTPMPSAASPKPTAPVSATPVATADSDVEIKDMDPIRRITSDRMILSRKTSAHVTTFVEADVTKLVNWRKKQKDAFFKHEGINLTYMPAIVEATAKVLIEFPQINASVNGYQILLKKHINIGIAVSLNDGNLIVPVIHDADKLSISGLALAIDSVANKARINKLKLDDIEGGTFTITNFGTFKNILGTPIINQPEVAILGVGFIEKKPAVLETPEGDVIAIRHKMYLSLSYDHRIVDGAVGGAFLRRIADYLENWDEK